MAQVLTWDGLPPKGARVGGKGCTKSRAYSESLKSEITVCGEGRTKEADIRGFAPPDGRAARCAWKATKRGRRCRCGNRFAKKTKCSSR